MGRRKLLITGFGPFPGVPVNPTQTLAHDLAVIAAREMPHLAVTAIALPTAWALLPELDAILADEKPDAVLALGVAARRTVVTPELYGRNRTAGHKRDDDGKALGRTMLVPGGRPVVRSRIDCDAVAASMREAGCPARVSQTAGTYLCNALAHSLYVRRTPSLFIHIPMPAELKARITAERPKRDDIFAALVAAARLMAKRPA
jgi:pyroglutamyl-peptidase